tara:strand:+ start:605 stop:1369 length:765 start_codon:yes stop_codon:yes gene_type:complete
MTNPEQAVNVDTPRTIFSFHFQAIKDTKRIIELEKAIADTAQEITQEDFDVVDGFNKRKSVELDLTTVTVSDILADKRGEQLLVALYNQALKSNLQGILSAFKTPTSEDVSIENTVAHILDKTSRTGSGATKTVSAELLKVLLAHFTEVLKAWGRPPIAIETQGDLMKARYNKNSLNTIVGKLTSRGRDAKLALEGTLKNLNNFRETLVTEMADSVNTPENVNILGGVDVLKGNLTTYLDAMNATSEVNEADYC